MTTYNQLKYPPSSIGNSSIAAGAVSPDKLDSNAQRMGFKNRIINGDMRIDQRNAGASAVGANGQFYVDRFAFYTTLASKFNVQQNAGAVTPPPGFKNYLGFTSTAATALGAGDYYLFAQPIEGFNVSDLAWGTSSAKTVTLSFWVRSSLTGTFGATLQNSNQSRVVPVSYTINSANTWEQKSITIAGDTLGTWLTNNGVGVYVIWSLGSGGNFTGGTVGAWGSLVYQPNGSTNVGGTNGATFYITGVQLEVGSSATTFDTRAYGTELALCQRYCFTQTGSIGDRVGFGYCGSTTLYNLVLPIPVTMRSAPTLSSCSPVTVNDNQAGYNSSSISIGDQVTATAVNLKVTSSGMTIGRGAQAYWTSGTGNLMILSAEL